MKKLAILFAALALQFGCPAQSHAETYTRTVTEKVELDNGTVVIVTTTVTYEDGKLVSIQTVQLQTSKEPEPISRQV